MVTPCHPSREIERIGVSSRSPDPGDEPSRLMVENPPPGTARSWLFCAHTTSTPVRSSSPARRSSWSS